MQHDSAFGFANSGSPMDVFSMIGEANGFDPHARPVAPPVATVETPAEETPAAPAVVAGPQAMVYVGRVRSGQRVVSETGDLIIVGDVNPGADLVAAGHIHVYGSLGGRAFAGTGGHSEARIFCQRFQAEIISIAGNYRSFELVPADLCNQVVSFSLVDGQLQFSPMGISPR